MRRIALLLVVILASGCVTPMHKQSLQVTTQVRGMDPRNLHNTGTAECSCTYSVSW
jgi:hypothetical protein